MATPAAPPSDPKAPNNANPVTEEDSSVKSDWVDPEELLTELRVSQLRITKGNWRS